jgi:hypothetical protein
MRGSVDTYARKRLGIDPDSSGEWLKDVFLHVRWRR